MCSIAYQKEKEVNLNMKFFEWWKNTSKNSDTECSQNEIKNCQKNSRMKNVKRSLQHYMLSGQHLIHIQWHTTAMVQQVETCRKVIIHMTLQRI